jgi:hypothetical protein
MSTERDPQAEARPVPWDTVLDNSFLASQGDPDLQNAIFYYLLTGPLKEQRATLASHVSREGMVAQHAYNMAARGDHDKPDELVDPDPAGRLSAESEQRDIFLLVLEEVQKAEHAGNEETLAQEKFDEIFSGFLMRDKYWYYLGGRPTEEDRWASFVIDFCIFKTGMKREGFSFSKNLLPAFKQMCEAVGVRLENGPVGQEEAKHFGEIVTTYLAHHPDLSDEQIGKLEAIQERLSLDRS